MKFQQTEPTAVTASRARSPQADNSAAGVPVVQLRSLSIEHAAIVLRLKPREIELVRCLGRGSHTKKIADDLNVPVSTAISRLTRLSERTRMTRLSLAILGYQLLGQERIDFQEAA